jgi:predicted small lipoprotein YifL
MAVRTFSDWPPAAPVLPEPYPVRNDALSRLSRRLVLPLSLVALALAADGCGRRGPMELPEASALAARPQPVSPDAQADNNVKIGLSRDISINDANNKDRVLAPAQPIIVPKTPFVLDPLL